MADPNRVYRVKELPSVLRLGRSTIYKEIASGRLRSLRVGRSRLVTSQAVADFIAELEKAGDPA